MYLDVRVRGNLNFQPWLMFDMTDTKNMSGYTLDTHDLI